MIIEKGKIYIYQPYQFKKKNGNIYFLIEIFESGRGWSRIQNYIFLEKCDPLQIKIIEKFDGGEKFKDKIFYEVELLNNLDIPTQPFSKQKGILNIHEEGVNLSFKNKYGIYHIDYSNLEKGYTCWLYIRKNSLIEIKKEI